MADTIALPNSMAPYVPRASAEWTLHTDERWRELDGTLCYIDISGFTALSEKLARRGRIGAEELTEVLGYVFGKMLGVAYDRGGSLLKFGGDALLLLFQGAEHPLQACSAAVEMQAVLREARDYRTSAGRLHLKMSVGLHSGTVHLFRVGGSHQELILTGPAASMTTEMEETATAGEILISSATRRALPRGSADRRKGSGWLLSWRTPRADGSGWTPRAELEPGVLEEAMPVALREYLRHGRAEPEHHLATVGFVKYEGVDALMAEGGPDAVAAALDELVRNVQDAVDREGVTFLASDIDADGGKIIIVGGVPNVQEDDEGRVLRAARRIADGAGTLTARIGVNQGHVFVGEIGTEFRATYTIMGDTVNLAARLMAAASPGEVYASPAALDRSLTVFETTALEPFHVKGKEHPVQAYAVGTEIGSRPAERRHELPFVGRAAELASLQLRVDELRRGRGGAVAVVGERGVGKSRLVDELLADLDGVEHLAVRAEPYGLATPYRPFRDPIRHFLGIEPGEPVAMHRSLRAALARWVPSRLPLLPLIADVAMIEGPSTPEADQIDPRFRQDRTADVLIELITAMHDGPLLIEVDDSHYMDAASAHVMARVVAATDERPWLVVATRRDESEGFDPGRSVIDLGPLGDEDARQIVVVATEAAPLRSHDVDAIVERAGGLPLFLEEIIGAVRQSGRVDDLPDSLDAVVSAQIDALPPLPQRLLRFASVLGRSFRMAIADRILAAEGTVLDDATRQELAEFLEAADAGRLRFRHAVIRDVAYEGLSFRRRRELHRRAGEAVEAEAGDHIEEQADILALHFSRAEDHERAWRYSVLAGDRARDTFANDAAATLYRQALDVARRLDHVSEDQKAEVWTSLGDVNERAGRFEDAFDAYRRAARLVAGDPHRRAGLHVKRAIVRRLSARYSDALRETARGLRLVALDLTEEGTRCRARLTVERGSIRSHQERAAEALRLAQEAESDASAVDDWASLASARHIAHWAHRMLGTAGDDERLADALALFERLGDMGGVALVHNEIGAEAYYQGRWDDAVAAYQLSRDAELRNGNDVQAAIPAVNTAEVLISQARFDEAEPLLVDAIRVLTASGHPAAGFARIELARLWARRGEDEAAEELLVELIDRGRAEAEPREVLGATLVLAELRLGQGVTDEAMRLVDGLHAESLEVAEVFAPTVARLRGCCLGAAGRTDEALAAIEEGLDQARQQGLPYEEALLLESRSELTGSRDGFADEDRLAADRIFRRLGVRRAVGALTG